jgi:hypothetical protein
MQSFEAFTDILPPARAADYRHRSNSVRSYPGNRESNGRIGKGHRVALRHLDHRANSAFVPGLSRSSVRVK